MAATLGIYAQFSPLEENNDQIRLIDRSIQLYGLDNYHTSLPFKDRKDVLEALSLLDSIGGNSIDRFLWTELYRNIPERNGISQTQPSNLEEAPIRSGLWNTFYKNPYSLWEVNTKDFFLSLNPVLYLTLGNDSQQDKIRFRNSRGVKINGLIDEKIYFYANILETQQNFIHHVTNEIDRISAIPGQGFFGAYESRIFGGLTGFDFLNSQGYVGAPISRSINVEFGHGRHFIGDGVRSMLLSNYADNYLYLKFNTKVWKLEYQNIFAELTATSNTLLPGDELLPKKYMATHYLSLNLSKRLQIGLFESVIFGRENGFELQYLNPIILYRSIERSLNSPDNALLGLNVKWIPQNKLQLYGQLLLDELKVSEAFSGDGWWGNKVAYQIGFKYLNLFNIDHLDIQVEHNTARPFTYGHRTVGQETIPTASYSHYNQSLAHPYGANFRETIFLITYRPISKLEFQAKFQAAFYGEETPGLYIGRNILEDYRLRDSDFGNSTGQGNRQNIKLFHFISSYRLFPNAYIDLNYLFRKQNSDSGELSSTNHYFGVSFRLNIGRNNLDF